MGNIDYMIFIFKLDLAIERSIYVHNEDDAPRHSQDIALRDTDRQKDRKLPLKPLLSLLFQPAICLLGTASNWKGHVINQIK